MEVDGFQKMTIPKVDPDYKFDRDTTLAIWQDFHLIKGLFKVIMNGQLYSYRTSCKD